MAVQGEGGRRGGLCHVKKLRRSADGEFQNATRNCALVSLFLREVFFSPPNIFPCFPGGWVMGKISPTLGISMFYPTSGTTV